MVFIDYFLKFTFQACLTQASLLCIFKMVSNNVHFPFTVVANSTYS